MDLSEAVDACYPNNRRENVSVVQATLFDLPFRPGPIMRRHPPDCSAGLPAPRAFPDCRSPLH